MSGLFINRRTRPPEGWISRSISPWLRVSNSPQSPKNHQNTIRILSEYFTPIGPRWFTICRQKTPREQERLCGFGLGNCAATAPRHGSMTSKSSWWRGWAASHSTPLNEIKDNIEKWTVPKMDHPKSPKHLCWSMTGVPLGTLLLRIATVAREKLLECANEFWRKMKNHILKFSDLNYIVL